MKTMSNLISRLVILILCICMLVGCGNKKEVFYQYKFMYLDSTQYILDANVTQTVIEVTEKGTIFTYTISLKNESEDSYATLIHDNWNRRDIGYFYETEGLIYYIPGYFDSVPKVEDFFGDQAFLVYIPKEDISAYQDAMPMNAKVEWNQNLCLFRYWQIDEQGQDVDSGFYTTLCFNEDGNLELYRSGWGAGNQAILLQNKRLDESFGYDF